MQLSTTLPFALIVSSLLAAGCAVDASSGQPEDRADTEPGGDLVASSQERIQAPTVAADDLAATVAGNTAFALDLYQQVRTQAGNLSCSPFSISEELAMTWAGARGDTEQEMATALHFNLPQSRLHPAFNALDRALVSRALGARAGQGLQVRFANALWGQKGSPFAAPFLDTLSRNYGTTLHAVDFAAAPERARGTINLWAAERTAGHIRQLVSPGSVTADTRLLLADAVYFSAAWRQPFNLVSTHMADFTRLDGTTVPLATMADVRNISYGEGEDYAAVEMPYAAAHLSLLLLLPPAGQLDAFEASLTPKRLDSITSSLTARTVTIALPRFKIASSFDLGAQLARLGMPLAFGPHADLSGIDGVGHLNISAVAHQAFISVDESGTEAAAASGTVFTTTAAMLPAEIRFDHPFVFVVRDNATGTILFLGRVVDPST